VERSVVERKRGRMETGEMGGTEQILFRERGREEEEACGGKSEG